ncbi:hypothetical protein JCM11641_008201 [Rhodosporidiobolus odoratus]
MAGPLQAGSVTTLEDDAQSQLARDLPPLPTLPPPPASSVTNKGKKSLQQWKEDDDDEWGESAGSEDYAGKQETGMDDEASKAQRARERAKRAVTSESWDDDFVFQHERAPPPLPRSSTSNTSNSRSRPTTPSHRQFSSSSASGYSSSVPPSTPSRSSAGRPSRSPPSSPGSFILPVGVASLSLDSLASSINLQSDHDATLTLDHSQTPRPPPAPIQKSSSYRSHRLTASTSTARHFPPSQQTTPKSRLPRTSYSPPPVPSSPSSRQSPPTDDDFRSATPSLTEDSLHSLTAGEELATDGETDDEMTEVAPAPREELHSSGGSLFASIRSATGSKKWRFGRRGSQKERQKGKQAEDPKSVSGTGGSSGIFGRRTGPREPEVMVIGREELEKDSAYEAVRSRLPRPTRSGDTGFVVLGQRTRTSTGTTGTCGSAGSSGSAIPVPTARVKHSSNASVSTAASSASTSRSPQPPVPRSPRTSLQFLPLAFNAAKRRVSLASSSMPPTPPRQPWREYDGTTSEDGGETTGADLSEFSGDEAARTSRASRGRGRQKMSGHRRNAGSAGGGTLTPSTSFMTVFTRPVSPESILYVDKARWNSSQVSFASTASAFALQPSSGERSESSTVHGKKRKLTKQRPEPLKSDEVETSKSLDASSLAPSPPSPSKSYSSSVDSNSCQGSSRTLQTRVRHCPTPSLPFAQDSEEDSANHQRRTVRQRSVTSPEQQQTRRGVVGERGQVIELTDDQEWLGVVPFPLSPRGSLDRSASPRLPNSTSHTSLRSPSSTLRRVSGCEKDRSHPPITARTQAQAKAKRSSGLGTSISNILSRSTSALPLGGKRAPSPVPSMKSSKSSRSLLTRKGSGKKAKAKAKDEDQEIKQLPKSPSLGMLKKRTSATVSPPLPVTSSTSSPLDASNPSTSAESSRRSSPAVPPQLPHSESAFSFFRGRGFSRSATKTPPPPSPRKSTIPRPSANAPSRPPIARSRSSMTRSRPSGSLVDAAGLAVASSSNPRGQLNTEFRMPRPTMVRPHSTISTVSTTSGSTASYASTLTPITGFRDAAAAKATQKQQSRPPLSGLGGRASGASVSGKVPPTRSAQTGHRASLSLSSIMPLRAGSPRPPPPPPPPPPVPTVSGATPPLEAHERPQTSLGGERQLNSYLLDEDLAVPQVDSGLPRRNSLSDLRIPARITSSQKKIEEDLDRVKQFAQGIEDLKSLRRQYDQLIKIFVEPTSPDNFLSPASALSSAAASYRPSSTALSKTAAAIRRVELDYSQWWEQAHTLINLGDGKATHATSNLRNSPGTTASRRDRCVSLALEKTPTDSQAAPSGSETETEESYAVVGTSVDGQKGSMLRGVANSTARRLMQRQASTSSITTQMSVEARQRDMLRGVLTPPHKGASLPSRGPPSPRPGLAVVTNLGPSTLSRPPPADETPRASTPAPTIGIPLGKSQTLSPSIARPKPPPSASRRVSRGGVFGIREFLLRLRSKATEELAASVGTLPLESSRALSPLQPGTASGRRSVSDPARRPHTPAASRILSPSSLGPAATSTLRRFSSSSSSDSGSDWDADLSPPRNSLFFGGEAGVSETSSMRRRARAHSALSTAGGGAVVGGKLILTTEAMPNLLQKVLEVREKCQACVGALRGLTV